MGRLESLKRVVTMDLDRLREELTETQHRLEEIEDEIEEHERPNLRLIHGGGGVMESRISEWLCKIATERERIFNLLLA